MTNKAQTFLIISLPDIDNTDVYKLEVQYTTIVATLTPKEQTLLRTCIEEPFRASDDCRGGGSELLFAHYLVGKQKTVVWETRLLAEREERFSLHYVDNKTDLVEFWKDMPKHDVCLIAQLIRECVEEDMLDLYEHILVCHSKITRRTRKRRGAEKEVQLSQFEKEVMELHEDDFILDDDDEEKSESNDDLETDE